MEVFEIMSSPQRTAHASSNPNSEQLHRSMPDLCKSQWDPFQFRRDNNEHNSAPHLQYTGEEEGEDDDDSLEDFEMDPIQEDSFTPRPASPRKKVGVDNFRRPLSMTLSPTSPSIAVSADLLACLEKLNGSAITDNNPFEPIPLVNRTTRDLESILDEEKVSRSMKPSPFDALRPPLT
jgi:hypothetical protein